MDRPTSGTVYKPRVGDLAARFSIKPTPCLVAQLLRGLNSTIGSEHSAPIGQDIQFYSKLLVTGLNAWARIPVSISVSIAFSIEFSLVGAITHIHAL